MNCGECDDFVQEWGDPICKGCYDRVKSKLNLLLSNKNHIQENHEITKTTTTTENRSASSND